MALEEIRESYYRLEQDYIKQKELLTKVEARVRELEEGIRQHELSPGFNQKDFRLYWLLGPAQEVRGG